MIKQTFLAASLCIATALSAFETDEPGIYAVFETSLGEFTAKIAYDGVPLTSANFIGLAEGTIPSFDPETGEVIDQKPFYNGLTFHQFYASNNSFLVVGGDPDPEDPDVNDPGYTIPEEFHPNLSHNPDYTLSMINAFCTDCAPGIPDIGQTTTGSQFFITGPATAGGPPAGFGLDGYYTVFGFVVEGSDVIDDMAAVELDETLKPVDPIVIESVTIVRVGEQANAFSVTDYELPFRIAAPSVETDSNGDVHVEIPTPTGVQVPIERSENLVDWIVERRVGENDTVEITPSPEKPTFVRTAVPHAFPIDYEQPLDAVFTINMPQAIPGAVWTFDFKPDGSGSVTIDNSPAFDISVYQHYRLPNGGKIRVSIEDIAHEMMITYRFNGENAGGILTWIDDYISGSNGNAERYPATGTFTFTYR